MAKQPSLYYQLIELARLMSEAVKPGKSRSETHNGIMYENKSTDVDDYFLRDAVAIIDLQLFDGLSAHACKMLLGIIKDMSMNNIFYRSTATTANERRSIAELKRAGILLATERVGFFIINPFKLRRGKPMGAIMASLHHYHKDNQVKLLKDLTPPRRALLHNGK